MNKEQNYKLLHVKSRNESNFDFGPYSIKTKDKLVWLGTNYLGICNISIKNE